VRSVRELLKLRDHLEKLKVSLQEKQYFFPHKQLLAVVKLLNRAIRTVNSTIHELKYDLPELAKSLSMKCNQLLNEYDSLDFRNKRALREYLDNVKYFTRYIFAAYYDFTGKLSIVKRAYKLYVLSFVISIILAPLIIGASIMFIGLLMFPLFISIHAFRARRKLGLVIASTLVPFILFISANALYYSIYALLHLEEVEVIASALNVGILLAYLILVGILLASIVSLTFVTYSFIVLYRHMDAFI